jgi:glucan biosynthesis protein C
MSRVRRHDIDWLRVLAFGVLVPYHVGLLFAPSWAAHVKNPVPWPIIEYPMMLVHQWRLPLLFVISGIGTSLAFRNRSLPQYLHERVRRLFVPLAVGVLVAVPPQVYVERLWRGQFSGSFLEFYPHFFTLRVYPAGNLSWHHLWFIAYLLAIAVLTAPLLDRLREGGRARAWLDKMLGSRAGPFLPLAPMCLGEVVLRPFWPTSYDLIFDLANMVLYTQLFLLGFSISIDAGVWRRIVEIRRIALALGVVLYGVMATKYWWSDHPLVGYSAELQGHGAGFLPYHVIRVVNLWAWVLACLGYGAAYLTRGGRWLELANQAVYPFYIIHQTVIVLMGFLLLDWNPHVALKFMTLVVAAFTISGILYGALIWPFGFMRTLFGVKPERERTPLEQASSRTPQEEASTPSARDTESRFSRLDG